MDYLSTAEVADLKGCTERYIRMMINDGKLPAKEKEKAANNRKEYLVSARDLPDELQKKYYTRQKKAVGVVDKKPVKKAVKQRLNTVKKAFEDYTANEREEMAFWIKILEQWQALRDFGGCKKTEIDPLFVSKCKLDFKTQGINRDISIDILYRKLNAYRNNDYDGLIDKRGAWNRGRKSIPKHMSDAFLFYYFDERRLPISRCYVLLEEWVKTFYPEERTEMPSERSFRRLAQSIPEAVTVYTRYGDKALSDSYIPYIERLYDDLNANDVWVADNHTFDFFTYSATEKKVHRLYLTAFIDAKSGVMVGWNLTDAPSSHSTLLALRHAILRFGVPKCIYVDNGSEFLTHDIGGRGHRRRKNWNAEDLPPTILTGLGIEMRNALVKNAKAKPIERTFGTLKNHISRIVETFCGGTIIERPESLKYKLKKGIMPEDQQMRNYLKTLIDYDYNISAYGGQEKRYKGFTRLGVWNSSIKNVEHRRASADELSLLLARTTRYQKISRNGVFITFAGEKLWYMAQDTVLHVGEEVYVRYNPDDLREVRIYDRETDKLKYIWQSSDMVLDYINADPEDIGALEANVRRSQKIVKAFAKGLTDGLTAEQKIDTLALSLQRAERQKSNFVIEYPKTFVAVLSDRTKLENPEISNITEVTIDIDLINTNAARRKEV